MPENNKQPPQLRSADPWELDYWTHDPPPWPGRDVAIILLFVLALWLSRCLFW